MCKNCKCQKETEVVLVKCETCDGTGKRGSSCKSCNCSGCSKSKCIDCCGTGFQPTERESNER